jgi:hypothetical protein
MVVVSIARVAILFIVTQADKNHLTRILLFREVLTHNPRQLKHRHLRFAKHG